jgi:hypothetical protein
MKKESTFQTVLQILINRPASELPALVKVKGTVTQKPALFDLLLQRKLFCLEQI